MVKGRPGTIPQTPDLNSNFLEVKRKYYWMLINTKTNIDLHFQSLIYYFIML